MIWKNIDDKRDYLKSVKAQIKESEKEVKELTAMLAAVNIIKQELDMRGSSIEALRELYKLIPPNTSLTIFDFEAGRGCILRGTADELSTVFKFITILEGSPYFKNVKVRYATKRAAGRATLADFEITLDLSDISEIEKEAK
jgi:Tfp pilus assembly protein PilN